MSSIAPTPMEADVALRQTSFANSLFQTGFHQANPYQLLDLARQYQIAIRNHHAMKIGGDIDTVHRIRMCVDHIYARHNITQSFRALAAGAPSAAAFAYPSAFAQLELGAIALGGSGSMALAAGYVGVVGVASYTYASVANHFLWEPAIAAGYEAADDISVPGSDATVQDVINEVVPLHPYSLMFNWVDENWEDIQAFRLPNSVELPSIRWEH